MLLSARVHTLVGRFESSLIETAVPRESLSVVESKGLVFVRISSNVEAIAQVERSVGVNVRKLALTVVAPSPIPIERPAQVELEVVWIL